MNKLKNTMAVVACILGLNIVLLLSEWSRGAGALMLPLSVLLTIISYQAIKKLIYQTPPRAVTWAGFLSDVRLYFKVLKSLEEAVMTNEEIPRFSISRDNDVTKIYIYNSSLFENRLKKFEELLEAGLPVNMLISSFERNASAKRYEVELFDSLKTRGEVHSDVLSYDRRVGKIPAGGYELQIGRYHVDMRKTPHMLIGGASGAGKTNLLNQLILQALWSGADLHIIDVKLELSSLAESIPFYSSYDEVMELLDRLHETIETRVSYMANNRIDDCSTLYSAVYLFFDELASFSLSCKSPKELKEFQNKIAKIILLGRKAGVFVIISGQYHTSETSLSVASRESLAIKIALGRANRTALEGLGFNVSDFDLKNRAFAKGEGYIYGMENQSRPALLQLDYLDFDMPEAVKFSKKI